MKHLRSRTVVLGAALTVLALALRWGPGLSHSLLSDEGSSYFFTHLSWRALACSLCDPHPPAYYLLLKGVARLGRSEMLLRLPSLLAGVLAAPLTGVTAATVWGGFSARGDIRPRRAAWLAAALVAVAPLAIWYSREARPYALLSLLALLMVWRGLHWRLAPNAGNAALYLLTGWAALWLEYGALVIWLGLNLLLLSGWPWRGNRVTAASGRRGWAVLQIALIAPFALWWLLSAQPAALRQMSYQAIFLAVQAQGIGLPLTPASAEWVIAAAALVAAGGALLAALLLRRSPRARQFAAQPWAAGALWAVLLALALLGAWPRLYTIKRHLNVVLPFVAIAAAAALSWAAPRPRTWRWAAGALLALNLTLSGVMWLRAPHSAWREIVAALHAAASPADTIWVDELDAPVFAYYWGSDAGWQPLRARDLTASDNTLATAGRVWLAGSVTPYRDLRQALPLTFIAGHAVAQSRKWPDAALTAYRMEASGTLAPVMSQALRWGLAIQSPLDVTCPR